MIKKFIKKLLIAYLNSRSRDQFRKHLMRPELEGWACKELKNIELQNQKNIDAADEFWRTSQAHALQELTSPDGFRNFLRLPTIQKTMYESYVPFLIKEYLWVNGRLGMVAGSRELLLEDDVGNPIPFLLNASTSGNLIHHLYHILKFKEFIASGIAQDFGRIEEIVEFGGGYGSLCRLFYRSGFIGKYVIQDLPTFSILQTYFLTTIGLNAGFKPHFSNDQSSLITCTGGFTPSNDIIDRRRLYVATWSLSEVGEAVRKKQEEVMKICNHFLIAYRDTFEGFDNRSYFTGYCKSRGDILWKTESIPHIPHSYYLFGMPKA